MNVQTAADVQAVKEEFGLTYEQFAALTGMHHITLWRIVHGKQNMSKLARIRISQVAEELAAQPVEQRVVKAERCADRVPRNSKQ